MSMKQIVIKAALKIINKIKMGVRWYWKNKLGAMGNIGQRLLV